MSGAVELELLLEALSKQKQDSVEDASDFGGTQPFNCTSGSDAHPEGTGSALGELLFSLSQQSKEGAANHSEMRPTQPFLSSQMNNVENTECSEMDRFMDQGTSPTGSDDEEDEDLLLEAAISAEADFFSNNSGNRTQVLHDISEVVSSVASRKSCKSSAALQKSKKKIRHIKNADIDLFGAVNSTADNSSFQGSKSEVHGGDSDCSDDEMQRNWFSEDATRRLSSSGVHIKSRIQEASALKRSLSHVAAKSEQTPAFSLDSFLANSELTVKKSTVQASTSANSLDADAFDPFFGIRILNPKISSMTFQSYVGERQKIRLSRLCNSSQASAKDWVTMAVVVEKQPVKKSQKGSDYLIWRISDLVDCNQCVRLVMFGESIKEHCKIQVGQTVALLNCAFGDSKHDKSSEISLKLDHPQKLLVLGYAKDFSFCKSTRKQDGQQCKNFVNKNLSDYCDYHIMSAGKKLRSKRGELSVPFGRPTKSFENKLLGKNGVFYGGNNYTALGRKASKGSFVDAAQQVLAEKRALKNDATAKDAYSQASNATVITTAHANESFFASRLRLATPGSLNLLKQAEMNSCSGRSSASTSIPASLANKQPVSSGFTTPSTPLTFAKFMESQKPATPLNSAPISPCFRPDFVNSAGQNNNRCSMKTTETSFALEIVPSTAIASRNSNKSVALDAAKRRALAVLKRKGPISKSDPNAVKPLSKSNNAKRAKLVATQNQTPEDVTVEKPVLNFAPKTGFGSKLGDIDLNSEDVKRLLAKNSSHSELLTEDEACRLEQYFKIMHAREKVEQRMTEITELKNCKVVQCKQSDLCKEERHHVSYHIRDKRFFKCNDCSQRTFSFDKYPVKPCHGCGSRSFQRVAMAEERKVVLESHQLKIRGDEIPFVNR